MRRAVQPPQPAPTRPPISAVTRGSTAGGAHLALTSDSSFTSPGGTCTSCRGSTPSWFVTCTQYRFRSGFGSIDRFDAGGQDDARGLGGRAPRRGPPAPRLPKSTGRGIHPRSGATRAPLHPPPPRRPRRLRRARPRRRPRRRPRQSREAGRNGRLGLRTDTASRLTSGPAPRAAFQSRGWVGRTPHATRGEPQPQVLSPQPKAGLENQFRFEKSFPRFPFVYLGSSLLQGNATHAM